MTTLKKPLAFLSLALALVALVALPANAAMVTYNVAFSANSFQVGSGPDPAPVDPVVGSVTVTLDPAVAVTNSTANISLNSLNIALGSAISFSYNPVAAGPFGPGLLTIGGINAGADTIIYNPSSSDFWLFIQDLPGTPSFEQLGYTQTALSSNNLFYTINQTGSASVTIVPEPASATVLGLGLVGLGVFYRLRKRSVAKHS